MTSETLDIQRPRTKLNLSRHRGLIAAFVVFGALLVFIQAISPKGLTYYDVSSLLTTGAPLALASIGQTFVIIVGGFDLSAGAAISLFLFPLLIAVTASIAFSSSSQEKVPTAPSRRSHQRR